MRRTSRGSGRAAASRDGRHRTPTARHAGSKPTGAASARQSRRGILGFVAVAAAIVLIAAGATAASLASRTQAGLVGKQPTPAAQPAYSAMAHAAYLLDALWEVGPDGSGAYRTLQNVATPSSLYQTVWELRLAEHYRIATPVVDRSLVGASLRGIIATPEHQDVDSLSAIRLAAAGLHVLRESAPRDALAQQLSARRVGPLFAVTPGGPPDWASTAIAVELGSDAGLSPPDGLRERVRQALPQVAARATDPNVVLNELLPAWDVADVVLTAAERAPLRPALESRLRGELAQLAQLSGSDALTLFVNVESRRVAAANDIILPAFDLSRIADLATPGGLLSVAPGGPVDPQATYYGALLGMPSSTALVHTVADASTPAGWRADTGAADARSSFFATALSHVLGRHDHDHAMRARTVQWLAELDDASADPSALHGSIAEGTYLLFLADELGIPRPASTVAHVRELVLAGGARTWDAIDVDRLLQLVGPPDQAEATAFGELLDGFAGQPRSVAEIFARWRVARSIGRTATERQLQADAARLDRGGACVAVAGQKLADLRSTLMCRQIANRDPAMGPEVSGRFADATGIWMFEGGSGPGNEVNLETTYLGLTMAGLSSDSVGRY